jgi:hypothetical protein
MFVLRASDVMVRFAFLFRNPEFDPLEGVFMSHNFRDSVGTL